MKYELSDGKELDLFLAIQIVEQFGQGEEYTAPKDHIVAWAYLISTGDVWSLQGWYGRHAQQFIDSGIIDKNGVVNWVKYKKLTRKKT